MIHNDMCASCPHYKRAYSAVSGDRWTAYHGDAVDVLRDLAAERPRSVDAIITDPPYGTGANSVAGRLKSSPEKYSRSKTPLPAIHGDSVLPDVWESMMRLVMTYALRLAKPGASALVFCDWRCYSALMRVMGNAGWILRGLLVWDKGIATRPSQNGFRAQSELILWARNGGPPERDQPVYLDGVFRYPTPRRRHHLTEKPVDLMKELVRICPPGGVVLDAFQGSGTTGVAALASGLHYIGIEAVEEYHNIAVSRLEMCTL